METDSRTVSSGEALGSVGFLKVLNLNHPTMSLCAAQVFLAAAGLPSAVNNGEQFLLSFKNT
jgi:hypothetical protein